MQNYPKRRNGDEYYPRGFHAFLRNKNGKEYYARDCKGNQIYPKRDRNVFARDASGNYYYAKTVFGDEYYPIQKNKSLYLIDPENQVIRLALKADGTQRYPTDAKGNEYYWCHQEKGPFLLRQSTGEHYLAQNKNGHKLIPWNHLQDFIGEDPCVFSKDANENTVYIKESTFPPAFRALIRCICHISVICPNVTGCHTRFL